MDSTTGTQNESVAAELNAVPDQVCEVFDPFPGINLTKYPLLAQNRMRPRGRALWVDGAPFLVRGVCYSPVPVGSDPGYGEPWGDYFTTEYYQVMQAISPPPPVSRSLHL